MRDREPLVVHATSPRVSCGAVRWQATFRKRPSFLAPWKVEKTAGVVHVPRMPNGIPPAPRPFAGLTTAGVFYDGNYFNHVSTYYKYSHPRRTRLSIAGLHRFVRAQIAGAIEGVEKNAVQRPANGNGRRGTRDETDQMRRCQIVDAHYFRGRLPAMEAAAKDSLLNERLFEDVLMKEGVITHSLPLVRRRDQSLAEKGLDVWFALETYELSLLKRYDVTVLVACDRDYLPLVRKLNALGGCVMVLGWDFTHTDEMGVERQTVTSIDLLAEATYPLAMHEIIETAASDDPLINGLFVEDAGRHRDFVGRLAHTNGTAAAHEETPQDVPNGAPTVDADRGPEHSGVIQTLKEGYGFISTEASAKNLFFSWADIQDVPFDALQVGDRVSYHLGSNFKGECATNVHKL